MKNSGDSEEKRGWEGGGSCWLRGFDCFLQHWCMWGLGGAQDLRNGLTSSNPNMKPEAEAGSRH